MKIVTCLFIFTVGVLLGIIINDVPYLTLRREISIAELTNFILTVLLAVWLPFYLNKRINNKRVEKDMLIAECDKLDCELHALRKLMEAIIAKDEVVNKQAATRIILRIRTMDNRLALLNSETESYQRSNWDIKDTLMKLMSNQIAFWRDATLNLRDRTPKITLENYMLVEKTVYQYSGNIAKLKIYINDK